MTDEFDARRCAIFSSELAELALGILSGRDRIAVLEHVDSCEHCRAELERLLLVADSLLGLVPEVEPPVGFEVRLADRLGPHRSRVATPRRAGLLATAAVVLALVGFALGAVVGLPWRNGNSLPAEANLTSAPLAASGRVLGEVMVSSGTPAWMFMSVDAGAWSDKVTCELRLHDGKVISVGVFKLANGYGAWGAPLPVAADTVQSASLVSSGGAILATAQLT